MACCWVRRSSSGLARARRSRPLLPSGSTWAGMRWPRLSDGRRCKSTARPARQYSHSRLLLLGIWECKEAGMLTRSEEHTSELQSPCNLVCRLLLEKKKTNPNRGVKMVKDLGAYAKAKGGKISIGHSGPFFFFNDTATPEIYTLSLHDALPI